MSKKVLKIAGERRTLLALIVMATLVLGIVISGWLTPTRSKAQEGGGNPPPGVESCTNCTSDGSVSLNAPTNTPAGYIGSSISVSVGGITIVPADVTIITTNSDGSTTTTNIYPNPTYGVTWSMNGVGANTSSGTGTTATFTPTNSGCGTVIFTLNYTNQSPCGDTGSSSVSNSFAVAQLSTNCTSGAVALGSSSSTNFWFGPGVSLSATNNSVTNAIVVTTHWPCGTNTDSSVTNLVTPDIITNWWTLTYGSYSTNGAGLSAAFTPTNPGSGKVTFYEKYKDNTPCNTNVQSAGPLIIPFNVISVTLSNMAFSGGKHQIYKDDGSGQYPSPEWISTTNYPVCYTRNTNMTVTPTFIVIPSTFTAMLVKGSSSGPQLPLASGTSTTITSTNNFTNCVSILKPMTIDWQVSIDNGTNWQDIATTANKVYVTWADTLNPIYTLLDVGCKGALGATGTVGVNDDSVLNGVWGKIQSKSIQRASDNVLLTYYGFYDVNTNGVWNAGTDINRNDPSLCTVTDAAGLISTGNGQCHSWADCMYQVLRGQGLTAVNGNSIFCESVVIKSKYGSGFAVQNWSKSGSNSTRLIINWDAGVDGMSAVTPNPTNNEAADAKGVAGQGNSPNPPSGFSNHYIFKCNNRYYDPSYGIGPFTDVKVYENAAFSGSISAIGQLIDLPATDTINTYSDGSF